MINVNQITATLAKLPDQALQRYAMMHKDDPYIMSLALAESNRRKEMRAGAQMQQQQAPKVVDQAIQGMAAPMPEDVGIGQLPAGNMNFAGGGIVAFADGGETDDMYPYGESVLRMADGGSVRRFNGMAGSFTGPQMTFQNYLQQLGITAQEFMAADPIQQNNIRESYRATIGASPAPSGAASGASTTSAGIAPGSAGSYLKNFGSLFKTMPALALGYELFGTSAAERDVLRRADDKRLREKYGIPESTVGTSSAEDVNAMTQAGEQIAGQAAVDEIRKAEQDKKDLTKQEQQDRMSQMKDLLKELTGGARPAGGPAINLATNPVDVANQIKAMRGQFNEGMPADVQGQLEGINALAREQTEERRNRLELQQAARGQFGEDQERRLKAREERINKEESNLFGTSLFQAGLAIMGGTSPHGMVNIAAGAQVGLKNYQTGIDKLSIARDKLDDAFSRLEEIRRNERRLDEKELNAAEDEVQKTILQGKKDILNTTMKYFEMDRQDAQKTTEIYFQNARAAWSEQQQAARHAADMQQRGALGLMQLMQEPSELRTLRGVAGDPKLEALYNRVGAKSAQIDADLVKEYIRNPTKLKLLEMQDPVAAAMIRQKMMTMAAPRPVQVENALP